MPRRKPTSTRQKKEEQKLKRAIKRGDAPAAPPKPSSSRRKLHSSASHVPPGAISSRRLQSSFVKLSQHYLDETKTLSAEIPLSRPIPSQKTILSLPLDARPSDPPVDALSCIRRPKWRYEMSKLEVEHNEEGVFKKWLKQTDEMLEKWESAPLTEGETVEQPHRSFPRARPFFERNLEVWRQLWRVTEISQIILVLLDCRCPLIHYPPSLHSLLSNRKVVLVLTKIDICGQARAELWKEYFESKYPGVPVVATEAYGEKEESAFHQGPTLRQPHLPAAFRSQLIDALKKLHGDLLQPPDWAKNENNTRKWTPQVKPSINWEAALSSTKETAPAAVQYDDQDEELRYLTIGLIGQPNVGKSSLLNAIFGAQKVRASRTPGKTKHFQTLFWTNEIRFVDCPGVVFTNFAPMELQVLSGILPISHVAAVPACIHFAAQYVPLEQVYRLQPPPEHKEKEETDAKRTWRTEAGVSRESTLRWTAFDILVSFANSQGWLTAKAGRPDIHRAGNAILRALADGKVHWAFRPPGSECDFNIEGNGIWIPRTNSDSESSQHEDSEPEDYIPSSDDNGLEAVSEVESAAGSEEEEQIEQTGVARGRFAALALDSDEASDTDEMI